MKPMTFTSLIIFGVLLALANIGGGASLTVPSAHRRSPALLHHLVALGAGFMLATLFIEMLPEIIALWVGNSVGEEVPSAISGALLLMLCGYLTIHLLEHVVAPHFHFGGETHREALMKPSAVWTAIGALSIHTFFDGISIAAGFVVSFELGLLLFLAVMLHKVPEGFTAASIVLAGGHGRRAALFAATGIGVTTLLGVLSIALMGARAAEIVRYALPFSAGVTLYVAASDLVPEVNRRDTRNSHAPLVVFGGVACFYLLHKLLGH